MSDFEKTERLMKAFEAANSVDVQPLIDQGLKGEEFAKALKQLRIEAVKKAIPELSE